MRCLEHVIKLAVKDASGSVRKKIIKVGPLKNYIRCSVKRCDVFEKAKVELGEKDIVVPGLDVDIRW